jgi:hypothetical protein
MLEWVSFFELFSVFVLCLLFYKSKSYFCLVTDMSTQSRNQKEAHRMLHKYLLGTYVSGPVDKQGMRQNGYWGL